MVLKALAWQSRSAARAVGDLRSLMAIMHQHKARLAGWKLGTAQGGTRADAAREFYVLVTMIDPQQRIDGLTMPTARFGALVRAHICELMTGRQPICSDVAVLCGRRTDTSRRDLKASHTSSCTATRAEVGRIPEGGGWRAHGKGFDQAKAVERAKAAGARAGYVYLHSAVDGFSRLAYTEALTDEKASTAIGFMHQARVFLRCTRHRPHQSDHHRQRLMPPRERLRQGPARRAPPADHPIHPTAQWQGRALQLRSCPRNSSTPEPGPASSSAHKLSKCGTCTTTTIDLTLPPETGHPRASSTPVSPTLWPHTTSCRPRLDRATIDVE